MTWGPISEQKIWDLINASCARMSLPQARLWEVIRIMPEKWQQRPYGDEGDGFWAAAVLGRTVVWYNDIKDGFNRSWYSRHGTIDEYWCNQDDLEVTVQRLLDVIRSGYDVGPWAGPPRPIDEAGA